jgi:multidrug efflux system membrane fusion protein
MKKNQPILTAIFITTLVVNGCKVHSADKPGTPVRVKTIEMISSTGGVRYSASISASTQVDLAFKVGGYVEHIQQVRGFDGRLRNIQEGDVVSKGAVLASLRRSDYAAKVNQAESQHLQARLNTDSSKSQAAEAQSSLEASRAQLSQAEATLARAKMDFERATRLFESQSMTRADFDAAKASHDIAQAQFNAAKSQVAVSEARMASAKTQIEAAGAQVRQSQAVLAEARIPLEDTSLRAPMNAVVLERKVEIGTLVSAGSPGFVLADTSTVKAVFGVPDMIVDGLKMGRPITLTSEAALGTDFHGNITAISASADPKSRVFEVEVTIPNPKNLLKVGMVVALALDEMNVPVQSPVVPLSAIVKAKDNPNNYAVFVVDERDGKQTARIRNVSLGEAFGNTVAIVDGVKTGEQVVTTGATLVVDGERVRIIP